MIWRIGAEHRVGHREVTLARQAWARRPTAPAGSARRPRTTAPPARAPAAAPASSATNAASATINDRTQRTRWPRTGAACCCGRPATRPAGSAAPGGQPGDDGERDPQAEARLIGEEHHSATQKHAIAGAGDRSRRAYSLRRPGLPNDAASPLRARSASRTLMRRPKSATDRRSRQGSDPDVHPNRAGRRSDASPVVSPR